jgi:aminoglycoside phosphotransferase (APT) family kinase protein
VREFVLRKDAPATIASSRTRREEYAIMKAANEAGVLTPDPVGEDSAVIGAPFAVMSMVEGVGWVRALPRTCRSAATVWSWEVASAGSWPKSMASGLRTPRSPS